MKKYKYYLRKPRSEIAKDILWTLLLGGVFLVAASSPSFGPSCWNAFSKRKNYPKRKFIDTFTRFLRKGLVVVVREGHDLKISLTPEGRKVAGFMQIDKLEIPKPRKWDRHWRLILFDIANPKTIHRNAFRAKLKDLGFRQLQKSAWIHPFNCTAEIELLRDFFGLDEEEVRVVIAKNIGNDLELQKHFRLLA